MRHAALQGSTLQSIGNLYGGIPDYIVFRWIGKRREASRPWTMREISKLKAEKAAGKRIAEIAAHFRRSPRAIRNKWFEICVEQRRKESKNVR